jgi:hypothetical protein
MGLSVMLSAGRTMSGAAVRKIWPNQPSGYSDDFVDLRSRRLPNWGRWGRISDCPNPNIKSHIADLIGIAASTSDGHGEAEDGTEAATFIADTAIAGIDHLDAEGLDTWIRQLRSGHRNMIRIRFYLLRPVPWLEMDASIRALMDLMQANRDTVRLLRRLGE